MTIHGASARYDNDYETISTGFDGVLGCSPDRCGADSALNGFNYYHPDWHPY